MVERWSPKPEMRVRFLPPLLVGKSGNFGYDSPADFCQKFTFFTFQNKVRANNFEKSDKTFRMIYNKIDGMAKDEAIFEKMVKSFEFKK